MRIALAVILTLAVAGCTQQQIDGVIRANNNAIAALKSPLVADADAIPEFGAYVRLFADVFTDFLYVANQALRILSPNAGEPTTQPAAQGTP